MNRLLGLAALLALSACGGLDFGAGDRGKAEASQASGAAATMHRIDRSHAGSPAPPVKFESRDGKTATLADFRGRRVLVNLWATWCAPCVAEMPELDRLAKAKAASLVVVPLSQDMEGWRAVDKFVARARFAALAPRLDQPGDFADAVKAKGLPMSILYDEAGKEVWRVAGSLDWADPAVKGL